MRLRTLLLLALSIFLPVSSFAGSTYWNTDDVTTVGYTYCVYSESRSGKGFVQTSGSSTTVTAVSGTPFQNFAIGDEIVVVPGNPLTTAADVRRVTAVASSTSITINSAATWTAGYAFQWRHRACGTTAADGGVDVTDSGPKIVQLVVTTLNGTSVTASVEGRISPSATWSAVGAAVPFTTTGSSFVEIPEGLSAVRVGWKVAGDAGVQSVSSYLGTSPRGLALEVTGFLPRFTTAALPTCSATQNYLRQVADLTSLSLKFCDGSSWTDLTSGGGITNGAGANVIPKSDGTDLVASGFTTDVDGGTPRILFPLESDALFGSDWNNPAGTYAYTYYGAYAAESYADVTASTSQDPYLLGYLQVRGGSPYNTSNGPYLFLSAGENQRSSLALRGVPFSDAVFAGSGLNDAHAYGFYTGNDSGTITLDVEIDATGTPDTFKWRKNGGSYTTGVAIDGTKQAISDGIQVQFTATTGHTLTDAWTVTVVVPTAFEIRNSANDDILAVPNAGGIIAAGKVPAVSNTSANSCGTSPATIAGSDANGIVTVGATSGTSCTVTFNTAAQHRRQCSATDETTSTVVPVIYLTTTTSKVTGTFGAGDVISYICLTY